MTLKRFIVPCFIVCEAPTTEVADEMASKYQTSHSGSYLLLDEGIPTVEVSKDDNIEYHSILDTPEFEGFLSPVKNCKYVVERWSKYKLGNADFQYNPDADKEFLTEEAARYYMANADSGTGGDTYYHYKFIEVLD